MKHGRRRSTLVPTAGALLFATGFATALVAGAACQKRGTEQDLDKPRPLGGPPLPKQSAEELNAPLAQVDDVTITVGQFEARLDRQSPYIRARYTSLEQKKEFLDALIKFEVMAKEAQRRGYDKDPEVVLTMKQVMIQKLMKEELDQKVTPDQISDADMKAYYDAHQSDYVKPEEVRVSAIIVKSKAQAVRVAAEAAGDAGKTNKGFRDLVEKYSQDPDTKLRSGDLRYLSQSGADATVPKPVIDAAFALVKIGDVSGAVDAGDGSFYVLKETGRRRAMIKTFDDAKPQIRNTLYRQKRMDTEKALTEELRQKAQIQVFDDNLAKVRIDMSGASGDGHGTELPTLPSDEPPPTTTPPAAGSGAASGSGSAAAPAAGSGTAPAAGSGAAAPARPAPAAPGRPATPAAHAPAAHAPAHP